MTNRLFAALITWTCLGLATLGASSFSRTGIVLDINGDGIFGSNEQSVISTVVTGYDELGRRVSETDASNRTKRYGYDVLGRLRHVIDYAGQATRFGYDEL